MATEKLKFKLELFATMWHLPPVAEIKLDGRSYFKSEISSTEQDPTKIEFGADLSEGSEYGLTIERTGKRSDQTVIDNKGNILKDQLLHHNLFYLGSPFTKNVLSQNQVILPLITSYGVPYFL